MTSEILAKIKGNEGLSHGYLKKSQEPVQSPGAKGNL